MFCTSALRRTIRDTHHPQVFVPCYVKHQPDHRGSEWTEQCSTFHWESRKWIMTREAVTHIQHVTNHRDLTPSSHRCCFTLAAGRPVFSSERIIVGLCVRRAGALPSWASIGTPAGTNHFCHKATTINSVWTIFAACSLFTGTETLQNSQWLSVMRKKRISVWENNFRCAVSCLKCNSAVQRTSHIGTYCTKHLHTVWSSKAASVTCRLLCNRFEFHQIMVI